MEEPWNISKHFLDATIRPKPRSQQQQETATSGQPSVVVIHGLSPKNKALYSYEGTLERPLPSDSHLTMLGLLGLMAGMDF